MMIDICDNQSSSHHQTVHVIYEEVVKEHVD